MFYLFRPWINQTIPNDEKQKYLEQEKEENVSSNGDKYLQPIY